MNKKIIFSSLVLAGLFSGSSRLIAQTDPYYTHFSFNKIMFNPAYAGAGNMICLNGISHQQYRGFDDQSFSYELPNYPKQTVQRNVGPKMNGIGLSMPIPPFASRKNPDKNYGGIGITAYNDNAAYLKQTNIGISLAGRIQMKNGQDLSLGFSANFLQFGIDWKNLRPLTPGDPLLIPGGTSQVNTTFGGGIYYQNQKLNNLYVGLSATGLKKNGYAISTGSLVFDNETHYYAVAGMKMERIGGNPSLDLNPSLLVKNTKGVTQVDLSAIATYQNKFAGGLAFRTTSDALSILLGYYMFNTSSKSLRIGYSYDITLSRVQTVSNGTHELQVNYCFKLGIPEPPPPIIIIPDRNLNRNINIE